MKISKLQLEKVAKRLSESNIKLHMTEGLVKHIAKEGYDPLFGARPIKRLIEDELVDKIAMQILDNKIKDGDEIEARPKEGVIEILLFGK